ncbi:MULTISPECIES: hypothetical protein [Halorussus]|uniref:hypothetical protein n=1 Tax=Halorussus TaxID=1070314 RepID=UPI00209FDA85|nr:hypothetical protein [Halorussus vallis]USZ76900.1 hypothetical protein NGM07_06110 [Halorussus vallis]
MTPLDERPDRLTHDRGDETDLRGLLAREHCRVGATVEFRPGETGGRRMYQAVPVCVDGEPAQLLVGPWRSFLSGERGRIVSVTGDEFDGRLLTVTVARE